MATKSIRFIGSFTNLEILVLVHIGIVIVERADSHKVNQVHWLFHKPRKGTSKPFKEIGFGTYWYICIERADSHRVNHVHWLFHKNLEKETKFFLSKFVLLL